MGLRKSRNQTKTLLGIETLTLLISKVIARVSRNQTKTLLGIETFMFIFASILYCEPQSN